MFLVTRSQVPWSKRLPNRCQENWNKTSVLWLSVLVVRMIIWIVSSIGNENIYQHWEKHHSGVPRPMWQPQPLRVEYKGSLPNIFIWFPSLSFSTYCHSASPLVAFSLYIFIGIQQSEIVWKTWTSHDPCVEIAKLRMAGRSHTFGMTAFQGYLLTLATCVCVCVFHH